jgi:predicted PurR-regulated permease PerM
MENGQPDATTHATVAKRPAIAPASVAICIVVVIGTLYFAREVLIPIALAVLLTFLLAPLVLRLQRWGLSRIPAVILIVTLAFAAIGAVGWLVAGQVMSLSSALPQYKQNIIAKVQALRGSVGGGTDSLSGTIKEIGQAMQGAPSEPAVAESAGEEQTPPAVTAQGPPAVPAAAPRGTTREKPLFFEPVEPERSPLVPLLDSIGLITAPLGTAAIVLIFTIFMLIGREDLRDRFLQLIGQDQLNVTTQAMDDAAQRVSRYLLMQSIVNGTYGLAVGIGLLVLGVPSALLWGLLAALLRFIPYVGPWIAAAFPIALSFAVSTTWTLPLLTIGLFVVLELISNNVIEPWLYGSGTGVSTMAILVAAIFWTWLWGPIGLLLATPLTVCVVVMGRYVPQLTFLSTLLGDESVLPPASRYYQRLLAMDEVEATDIAKDYLKQHPLPELYDAVLLPALGLAEQDGHRGTLTSERQEFIRRTTRTLVEELGQEGGAADAPTPPAEARLMCLPARDEADEIAGLMFARLLGKQGIPPPDFAGARAGKRSVGYHRARAAGGRLHLGTSAVRRLAHEVLVQTAATAISTVEDHRRPVERPHQFEEGSRTASDRSGRPGGREPVAGGRAGATAAGAGGVADASTARSGE